jgi:hypothetical protein
MRCAAVTASGLALLFSGCTKVEGPSAKAPPFPDYTRVSQEITPVVPKRDPRTGFVVGGKNPTALIKTLTEINGRAIPELEKDMRPGASSTAGFLGKEESLLAVMAADNSYVVDELGLTHQELAKHLRAFERIFLLQFKEKGSAGAFLYNGRAFGVGVESWFDLQGSPFGDNTATAVDVTVTNLHNGKVLKYSGLVPLMMERYGFYEGKGTSYRVEPRDIVQTLDFLKKGDARAP